MRRVKVTTEGVEVQGRVKPEDMEHLVALSLALFGAKMGVLIEHNKNVAGAVSALNDAAKIVRGDDR